MRHQLAILTLVTAATCACSQESMTSERAARLIAGTDGFKREARFTLQTNAPMQTAFECLNRAEVERMPTHRFAAERGWIRYDTSDANLGFGKTASCPTITLTPTGEAASARWTRGGAASSPEAVAWSIPIGRRELIGVPTVTLAQDESGQVEFDWKWSPNDTGNALRSQLAQAEAFFNANRKGRAACRRTSSDWLCQLAMWTTPADGGDFQP